MSNLLRRRASSRTSKTSNATTSSLVAAKSSSSKIRNHDQESRAVRFHGAHEGEDELAKLPLAVLDLDLYDALLERGNHKVSVVGMPTLSTCWIILIRC